MIMDKENTFCQAQAVTAAAASTDVVDFSEARNVGVGEQLYVVVCCTVAMTDASSDSTLAVALEGDSTTSFTPDYTRTLFTFPATSAAGTVKVAALGPDDLNLRYARLYFTPANGNLSTGSFTGFITKNPYLYTSYADAITIS
jgi:hypothetical protein